MTPVTLFLTAVRIMNFNLTTSAASIHGSVVILCLATIIVSVNLRYIHPDIPLAVDAGDEPC